MENQEPPSRAWLPASIVLAVVVGAALVAGAYWGPNSTPTSTTKSTASSQSATSSPTQSQEVLGASCVIAIPYDSMQRQFGGCGYYLSVLYNGCCYAQSFPNGTEEFNLGWTLIVGARQSTGPSENATFGWDPAGPSISSGERLPGPVRSTLFNGSLTIQWRLYNSTTPLLYAWMIASFPGSEQFITGGSASTSCQTTPWPSQVSTVYQPAVQQIGRDPAFVALTGGLCYSYVGNSYSTSSTGNATAFFFDRYNGTIFYLCGSFPAKLVVSRIEVDTIFNADKIDGITETVLENDWRDLNTYSCPGLPPVGVRSATLVPPYTPAGSTIELTLSTSLKQTSVTNLTAALLVKAIESGPLRAYPFLPSTLTPAASPGVFPT